eukprot:scaffold23306_cov125-Isochrysis_galbana.AAC.7
MARYFRLMEGIARSACPPRARIVAPHIQASPEVLRPAACAATCDMHDVVARRASSRICSPCSECVKGAVSGQNGAECDAEQ